MEVPFPSVSKSYFCLVNCCQITAKIKKPEKYAISSIYKRQKHIINPVADLEVKLARARRNSQLFFRMHKKLTKPPLLRRIYDINTQVKLRT